ncbi:MAG: hypothetical protein GY816_09050 [Cytophagales bacterium]|nr:hypothetical protein [Cytophagales bacterium]
MVYKKDLVLQQKWVKLLSSLGDSLGKKPKDLNNLLYLIGIQELGKGILDFSKDEKQDLIHIAICKVLSLADFYELEGIDEEGWPHWKPTSKLPRLDIAEQEQLLKIYVIEYFEKELNVIL